jgi:hypothetical protein
LLRLARLAAAAFATLAVHPGYPFRPLSAQASVRSWGGFLDFGLGSAGGRNYQRSVSGVLDLGASWRTVGEARSGVEVEGFLLFSSPADKCTLGPCDERPTAPTVVGLGGSAVRRVGPGVWRAHLETEIGLGAGLWSQSDTQKEAFLPWVGLRFILGEQKRGLGVRARFFVISGVGEGLAWVVPIAFHASW